MRVVVVVEALLLLLLLILLLLLLLLDVDGEAKGFLPDAGGVNGWEPMRMEVVVIFSPTDFRWLFAGEDAILNKKAKERGFYNQLAKLEFI